MDFVKKHYEKIILGVVLIGLAAVVVFLFIWVSDEQSKLRDRTTATVTAAAKPLEEPNEGELLKGIAPVPTLDLSMTNRLFNPVEWQRTPDNKLKKIERGDEVGPKALVVTNITPLYLTISLDSIVPHDDGNSYGVGVQDESAATASLRAKKSVYLSLGGKSPMFTLLGVKGTADAPELVLVMTDTGTTNVISKAKPFQRVAAFTVDMRYDPEKLVFRKYRVGSLLTIGREQYKIVDIKDSEVVVSATSNDKRTTIKYSSARSDR